MPDNHALTMIKTIFWVKLCCPMKLSKFPLTRMLDKHTLSKIRNKLY